MQRWWEQLSGVILNSAGCGIKADSGCTTCCTLNTKSHAREARLPRLTVKLGSVAAPVVPLTPTMPKECGVGLARGHKTREKIALKNRNKNGGIAHRSLLETPALSYEIGYILLANSLVTWLMSLIFFKSDTLKIKIFQRRRSFEHTCKTCHGHPCKAREPA